VLHEKETPLFRRWRVFSSRDALSQQPRDAGLVLRMLHGSVSVITAVRRPTAAACLRRSRMSLQRSRCPAMPGQGRACPGRPGVASQLYKSLVAIKSHLGPPGRRCCDACLAGRVMAAHSVIERDRIGK